MKFQIKHEIKGRIRVHVIQKRMSFEEADTLQYCLEQIDGVSSVRVNERVQDAVVCYVCADARARILDALRTYSYRRAREEALVPQEYLQNSGRSLNHTYWEKLVNSVVLRIGRKFFVPYPIRAALTAVHSVKYISKGVKKLAAGKIEVPVLDATAIGVSMLRGNFQTASSIMFLLGIGETLEEWTHKKSVGDLARSMALNADQVWLVKDGQEVLVSSGTVRAGDLVCVHMGNVIPFDGVITAGEGMVNQASLTGESLPVRKSTGKSVYAGTVLEEGEITVSVKQIGGASRYEKIVAMIEESEKLKSSVEGKAEHLADRLVPYTLLGTGLVYLLTRNVTKAIAVLMVDFSCALKLAMPISVLSAIREAGAYRMTVKGGKYMEALSEADTIVFDKTGTLTRACPTVVKIVPFNGASADEMLRLAACLEEHFPHSVAAAVVKAAKERNLEHEEMHSKVEYIVAHGISTTVEGKPVVIGSYHFVFEDEKCTVPEGMEEVFSSLPAECSHLYLAVEQSLAAVICIADPLREEAPSVVEALRKLGLTKIVMMTGDSERTAAAIAKKVGVDAYYSEVLPEDKARFVEQEKTAGRKVIMVGDGINDSLALSASDVGIAISDGAQIAREVADVTIAAEDLRELLKLRRISETLMARIHKNYRLIVGINSGLIALGVAGVLQPTTSALLHNASTLLISLKSMENLLPAQPLQES